MDYHPEITAAHRCQSTDTIDGLPCQNWIRIGSKRCYLHGGTVHKYDVNGRLSKEWLEVEASRITERLDAEATLGLVESN